MNISPNAEKLRSTLAALLRANQVSSIQLTDLQQKAKDLGPIVAPGITDIETKQAIDLLMEQYMVVMGDGYGVVNKSTFETWIEDRRDEVDRVRSNAYSELLMDRGWSGAVIETLDRQTDRILDLAGDPRKSGSWTRRGIAIGEVQSGKTATYISLLAKAIDYGYKIIIVIGGHTEDLRRQTQSRLDSDLTGIDSAYLADNISHNEMAQIGIGKIDKNLPTSINVLTTTQADFSSASKRAGRVAVGAGTPTLFVVKKNNRVLLNLAQYLSTTLPKGDRPPLLLIDDEADWASINTNSEDDVTAVNAAIRKLLASSNKNSYLGITATPFANIFVNDEIEEDLFPRDFIQVLESPSNYQGVSEYFTSASHPALVEDVDDTLSVLPYSHKASSKLSELPQSLRKAIASFYVGTAIRRFRDGGARPASMLINVSRFKAVQAIIHKLVESFLNDMNSAIMGELGMPDGSRQGPLTTLLRETYSEVFPDADVTWMTIRDELISVADEMRTQLINGDTKVARDKWLAQTPRRVREVDALIPTVYVGGDVLARGLTLDGLQVSYYARRAAAADTLLQMGRWFGYRPGYEDLVRLWIDPETSELFRWTADLSQRLRESLAEMNAKGLTPKDFGLKMQRHPEGFQIANAKKMQHAADFAGVISLNSSVWESHTLKATSESREQNLDAIRKLVAELGGPASSATNRIWRGINSDVVLDFLREFRSHELNHPFGAPDGDLTPIVTGFADIKNVDSWDIALIEGKGRPLAVPGLPTIRTSVRHGAGIDGDILRFPNRRVAAGADLAGLVPAETRAALQAENGGKPLADRELARKALTSPTLMIYLVTAKDDHDETDPSNHYKATIASPSAPIPAIVIATPQLTPEEEFEEIAANKGVKWKINRVLARQLLGWSDDSDDVEEDEL